MKGNTWTVALVMVLTAVLLPAGALSQTEDAAIERRIIEAPTDDTATLMEDRFVTGKGDLLLLEEPDLWTVRSDSTLNVTDNAFLSDDRKEDDVYFTELAWVRFNTVIAQKYLVFADAGVTVTRYNDNSELDNDTIFVRGGVRRSIADMFLVQGILSGDFVRDRGFDETVFNRGKGAVSVRAPLAMTDRFMVVPQLAGRAAFADPSDFSFYDLSAGVNAVFALTPKLRLRSGVEGRRRWYPDYFESQTGEERRDWLVAANIIGVEWEAHQNVTLKADYNLRYQDSTVGFLDFTEHSGAFTLTLEAKF